MNDNNTLADDLRKDSLALMKLLADEKHKSEALAAALRRYVNDGPTPQQGWAGYFDGVLSSSDITSGVEHGD